VRGTAVGSDGLVESGDVFGLGQVFAAVAAFEDRRRQISTQPFELGQMPAANTTSIVAVCLLGSQPMMSRR
jgi:hypothetical protein